MDWVFNNDMPIYTQLVDKIKLSIVSGQLPPGDKLATVRDLAAEAKVNPNTMQRAFQELERLGLVYSQRGNGRFVTENVEIIAAAKKKLAEKYISDFMDSMEQLGYAKEEIMNLLKEEDKQ
jgi:DNA-binding transcriptional regulator YhcF (GntR family)